MMKPTLCPAQSDPCGAWVACATRSAGLALEKSLLPEMCKSCGPAALPWQRVRAAGFREEAGNQTIKRCRRKLLSQNWGNHVKRRKKKPWWGGGGIGGQVAAKGCRASCWKNTFPDGQEEPCYTDITHVPTARCNRALAARVGDGEAGAGLWHGAGTAGDPPPWLSRRGHPGRCGVQGEVVRWGTPCAPSASSCHGLRRVLQPAPADQT